MEISGFRSFRMALGMSVVTNEDAASDLPPMAPVPSSSPPDANAKQRTDSASSTGSQRSNRSGRSSNGTHRRRSRHAPSSNSREPSQNEELQASPHDYGSVDDGDDDDERARDEMREDVICAIFDLPHATTFYKDFSCAIAAAFPMHGRMYPTSTHVCFYSNVFGRERKILIPYESITELTKTTTLVFQGAIRIKTSSGEDYTFSSFWGANRDRCFDLIVKIRNRVLGLNDDGTAATTNTGNDDPAATTHASPSAGLTDEDDPQQRLVRSVSDGGIVPVPRDMTMELLVEEKFPISVDDFIANFIADDASFGWVQYNQRIGSTEMQCNPWSARSEDDSLGETRSLQFRVPIDSPIGPNSSMVDVLQCHKTGNRGLHTIETSTRLVDIPYGDYFSVEDRWTVVPHPRSPNECTLTIELKVVFSKSTFWKGQIESRAIADNKAKWLKWVDMAKEHLRAPAADASMRATEDTSVRTTDETDASAVRVASPPSRSNSTGVSAASNGTPLHTTSCPEKGLLARRPTRVVVESRAVDSVRDRSRASPRTQTSDRRVSPQALPWIIIMVLLWIIVRLNSTLTRMEKTMLSTEARVAEIQQQISRLHANGDVCR